MGREAPEAYLLRCVCRCGLAAGLLDLTLPGKILKDEETVGSYNIEEKGFVVCMVNKVRLPAYFML